MIDPFFDNLRLRASRIFGSLRLGRRDWLASAISEGEHEDSAEDIGSLAISYLRADAARGDPGLGAELQTIAISCEEKLGNFELRERLNPSLETCIH